MIPETCCGDVRFPQWKKIQTWIQTLYTAGRAGKEPLGFWDGPAHLQWNQPQSGKREKHILIKKTDRQKSAPFWDV